MKGIISTIFVLLLACTAGLPRARAFAPVQVGRHARRQEAFVSKIKPLPIAPQEQQSLNVRASNDETDSSSAVNCFLGDVKINIPYALAYVAFLGFAYMRQSAEPEGASMEVIQQFIADPFNPGFNELFLTVFNLLGLYFAPMACLLMPGARDQKFPATPFLLGSMFGGYGVLGLYASTREARASPVTKAELGWFTANVLENKLLNYFVAFLFASAYITSGALAALVSDPSRVIEGYGDIFSETAIASASSLDFFILTLTAASWIPEDLSRRGCKGKLAPEIIALSTIFLPGVGVAVYCALRPSLSDE